MSRRAYPGATGAAGQRRLDSGKKTKFARLATQDAWHPQAKADDSMDMRRNGWTTRLSRMKSHVTLSFSDKAEIGYVNSFRPGGMAGDKAGGPYGSSSKIADKK